MSGSQRCIVLEVHAVDEHAVDEHAVDETVPDVPSLMDKLIDVIDGVSKVVLTPIR